MTKPRPEPRKQDGEHVRGKYPYLHPEALHPEHLAIDTDDILEFLDHFGDEGPDLKSSSQAP